MEAPSSKYHYSCGALLLRFIQQVLGRLRVIRNSSMTDVAPVTYSSTNLVSALSSYPPADRSSAEYAQSTQLIKKESITAYTNTGVLTSPTFAGFDFSNRSNNTGCKIERGGNPNVEKCIP